MLNRELVEIGGNLRKLTPRQEQARRTFNIVHGLAAASAFLRSVRYEMEGLSKPLFRCERDVADALRRIQDAADSVALRESVNELVEGHNASVLLTELDSIVKGE